MASDTPQPAGQQPEQRPAGAEPQYAPAGQSFRSVTDKISSIVLARPTGLGWQMCFAASLLMVTIFLGVVIYLIAAGVGIWGIDIPVAWVSPSPASCGGSVSDMPAP